TRGSILVEIFEREDDFGGDVIRNLLIVCSRASPGWILLHPFDNSGGVDLRSTAVASVRKVCVNRLLASRFGGSLVTDSTLKVKQDVKRLPRLSDVTKWVVTFDRTLDFDTGFVVALELDQFMCDIVSTEAFPLEIA